MAEKGPDVMCDRAGPVLGRDGHAPHTVESSAMLYREPRRGPRTPHCWHWAEAPGIRRRGVQCSSAGVMTVVVARVRAATIGGK